MYGKAYSKELSEMWFSMIFVRHFLSIFLFFLNEVKNLCFEENSQVWVFLLKQTCLMSVGLPLSSNNASYFSMSVQQFYSISRNLSEETH